jgi:argininosuccinate synthase
MKSRGVYETPGGTILSTAHRALEMLVLDRDTAHYKQQIALKYAEMVYYGQWFCKLREALDAFVNVTQENMTGTVRLKLYKGQATLAGVRSPKSLYNPHLASFTMDAEYNSMDATGFIKLFGLPMTVAGMVERQTTAKSKKTKSKKK